MKGKYIKKLLEWKIFKESFDNSDMVEVAHLMVNANDALILTECTSDNFGLKFKTNFGLVIAATLLACYSF